MTVHQWGKDGSRFLQGLPEISEVKIIQLQRHGRAVADMEEFGWTLQRSCLAGIGKWKNIEFMPTVLVMNLFAAAMRERFVCHFHISTICQQSHMSTNFKILGMSIFQPFAINFACQPILAFSTICRIWRSPAICNNFSDAFVGGRLARADEWENVFFFLGGVISTFQRFVKN